MGGGTGLMSAYFGQNIGNRNLEGNRTGQAIANLFDPTGMSSYYTMAASEMTGATSGGRTLAETGAGEAKPQDPTVEPIPEDPAIASSKLSEEARQEEMRKRRIRTKTLLSDQEDQGTATVGTKVLLGG